MSNAIVEGIIIGGLGGLIAGLTIWFVQLGKEKSTEKSHKDRIHKWLYQKTKQQKGLTVGDLYYPRWIPTIEIASNINLTPDRVRYICSIDERIRLKTEKDLSPKESLEEKWGVREVVD